MTQRKLAGAAATLIAVAGLAAGCGGGSDSADKGSATTTSGAPLTKAQYIGQADAICEQTIAKLTEAGKSLREENRKTGKPAPVAKLAKFLTQTGLPAYDAMLGKLSDLKPPPADTKTIDALLAALAGAIETINSNPVKYAKVSSSYPFDDANKRAKQYGLKVCGS